jgi:rhodanese-related sulfurtransferase
MELTPSYRDLIKRINTAEILVIIGVSCCVGVMFNFFWINRVPLITPSKAELYALKNIPSITLEKTKEIFDSGGTLFLDARRAADYDNKHIKGAVNLPVSHFELYYPKVMKNIEKDADIVVYCEGEECGASLHLSEELIKLKYSKVQVFLGGWVQWNKAGYPSE